MLAFAALAAGAGLAVRVTHDDASAATEIPVGRPVVLDEGALEAFGRAQAQATYWAGQRTGARYELTRTATGRVYIRYLTGDAKAGDPRARYLTVATYPHANGYTELATVARGAHARVRNMASGARVVWVGDQPRNVYFAFAGVPLEVEVFDPEPGAALALVLGGQVQVLR